jgi:2-keto-3-deoxy-L-rhamnonate aldolase RhmA
MDAGSTGIIVPMVNSPEQVVQAYEAMQYPPIGKRGVGLSTAQGFGAKFEEYLSWLKENALLIVQIEHIEAVKNFEKILSRPEVDGFIVGPYDLSASLGKPGQFQDGNYLKAIAEIDRVQSKISKARGIHIVEPDIEQVKNSLKTGYDFIAYSFEMKIIDIELRKARNAVF